MRNSRRMAASPGDQDATLVQVITPDMESTDVGADARARRFQDRLSRAAVWIVIPVGVSLGWWVGGKAFARAPDVVAPAPRQPMARTSEQGIRLSEAQPPAAAHQSIPIVAIEDLPLEAAKRKTARRSSRR